MNHARVHSAFRVLALTLVALLLVPALARADLERSLDDPTAWWWLHGVTAAQITDLINDEGARLVDLEVEDDNPLLFSAAFVKNSGGYASGWWWLFGQTTAQISTFLSANTARLIDLERYDTANGPRWAAVMVPNTGSQAKTWWWYVGATEAQVTSFLNTNNARLVDMETYVIGATRYFDVVMIRNTGSDASGWWWYYDQTLASLQTVVANTGGRILDIETYTVGGLRRYAAILKANPSGQYWWWWVGQTEAQVTDLINQHGSRIADVQAYFSSGAKRFAVMMLNNSNDLTTSIATQLGYGSDGTTGFYLKQVNGPVLANINQNFAFEPSSTLKVAHHLHAMHEVAAGNDFLNANVNYSTALSGSCPTGGAPFVNETLSTVLSKMMYFSDNAATMAIKDRYGLGSILNTAQGVVGMSTIQLTRDMGCSPPGNDPNLRNRTTLVDLGLLYEGVANGVFLAGQDREDFYSLMQSDRTPAGSQWWFTNDLENLVVQEAANLGIPDAASSFLTNMEWAWKPGGDTLCFPGCEEYRSVAGWVRIPECGGRIGLSYREYIFGLFIYEASDPDYADDRLLGVTQELFRDLIRDALQTCPTDAPSAPTVASRVELREVFPNPFNPQTTVLFSLSEAMDVRLEVFDVRGRRVAVLDEGFYEAGEHSVPWNGRDISGARVASGSYVIRLQGGDESDTRTVVLLK